MPSISVPITFSRTGEMTTDEFKDVSDPVSMDVHYHKRFLIFMSKFWETGGQESLACSSPWGCKESVTT